MWAYSEVCLAQLQILGKPWRACVLSWAGLCNLSLFYCSWISEFRMKERHLALGVCNYLWMRTFVPAKRTFNQEWCGFCACCKTSPSGYIFILKFTSHLLFLILKGKFSNMQIQEKWVLQLEGLKTTRITIVMHFFLVYFLSNISLIKIKFTYIHGHLYTTQHTHTHTHKAETALPWLAINLCNIINPLLFQQSSWQFPQEKIPS